jgi:D-ribose pyranase
MKKGKVLNNEISHVISTLGHTDTIVIGDCGLPIPDHVKRIDLALTLGVPSFLQTLQKISFLDENLKMPLVKSNGPKCMMNPEIY